MIYIEKTISKLTYQYEIKDIWLSGHDNLEELYKQHIISSAKEQFNLVINEHWLNVMDYKLHNSHLTQDEFKQQSKQFKRFLKKNTFGTYVSSNDLAIKQEYKTIC